MKHKLGTAVLFVLLLLAVVAIKQIDVPASTTVGSTGETNYTSN
ncbi:MAG TPA: hypothetical protein VFT16_04105 [Candidatus Saccharimonadales bacterium]|nr:hypothetical protein [Candidatus Saccharimonadales bacterium]